MRLVINYRAVKLQNTVTGGLLLGLPNTEILINYNEITLYPR
jgi:hypothetical protein